MSPTPRPVPVTERHFLAVENVNKCFGETLCVEIGHMHVYEGEVLALLGPSGCGKTTTLRLIAGLETPDSGRIALAGREVSSEHVFVPPEKRKLGLVFQDYALFPHLTVAQNIRFGLQKIKGDIEARVQEMLGLTRLSRLSHRFPHELSGGEQQRTALARCLAPYPHMLLLDEPFSSLDAALRLRLREELLRIQRRLRITTIFVTHDQEEALSLADRIALMQGGQIEQLDAPSRMYAWPRTLFAAEFIGAMNLLPARWNGTQLQVGALSLPQVPAARPGVEPTVAIRPEDFEISLERDGDGWPGVVEQAMDMGHYRKLLVASADAQPPFTVYAAKSLPVEEGVAVSVQPARYLIYAGDEAPQEVTLGNDSAN